MHGVALLLAAAAVGHAFARLLRVPSIPLLLLAGLGLSRVAPLPVDLLEDALVLGVSFLLFVGGLELDPRRMRAQGRAALRVGSVQFVVLALLGFGAARGLGMGAVEAGYVAVALTASSTLVGVRLLQRRQQMFEPFGRLVLGVLLLQDVLVLLSIPLVEHLGGSWGEAFLGFVGVAVLGGLALVLRRWGAPMLLAISADTELLLLVALVILFAFLGLGGALGLPLVVGSFLAGVSLARFPVNGVVRIETAPVADFFTALFFTALGALVDTPSAVQVTQVAALTAVVLLTTVPVVTVVAERSGFSARSAIEAGLLLSQTSEISLVIGLSGMLQGAITGEVFTVIAWTTLVTMLLTPFLATDRMTWRLMRLHPAARRPPAGPEVRGHVLLLGAGSTGMPLLEDLILSGADVMVVDDDPAVLAQLDEAGVRTLRGDAAAPTVLEGAGAGRARVICSTIRRPRDNAAVLEMAKGVPVLVRVFDRVDADWIRARGGTPILYSEATAEGLMEWMAEREAWLEQGWRERAVGG